ncbi:heterokaryon incompatibility protein-domain-containing protein [Xylaria acuta]|nr:heterokaryon incompatibility protein-domain-containing protein [Xylaria acuta]
MSSFPYPPLTTEVDAIRVLKLEPGDFADPLVGTLTQAAFSEKPKYVALSYTWGVSYPDNSKLSFSYRNPTADSLSLKVNNEPLRVGRNLYLALLHLRSLTHPITLWVDAICINQTDTNERNHQVSLMSFIYTRATRVVAWVGMKKYTKTTGLFRSMSLEWKAGQARYLAATLVGEGTTRYSPKPTQSTIARIAESGYWTRLWIVQEVCLPRLLVLVYGSEMWTYDNFLRWATPPADGLIQCPSTASVFGAMMRLFETREKRHTEMMRLETLIERFASSKCLELRDRVFGLLGCANDIRPYPEYKANIKAPSGHSTTVNQSFSESRGVIGSLRVDYSSSFYQIWANVVKFAFLQAKSIEGRIHPGDSNITGKEEAGGQIELVLNEERAISIIRTAGIVQTALDQKVEEEIAGSNCIAIEPDLTVIRAVGYIAGKVVGLGPKYSSLIGSSRAQQDWVSCWPDYYKRAEDMEILRRIGEDYTAKLLDCKQSDIDRVRNIRNTEVIAWPATWGGNVLEHPSYAMLNGKEICADMPSRDQEPRMCLGTGYVMGLVPPATKPGDIIVRFWDCDAAIVVRPTKMLPTDKETPSLFSLVGRASIADVYDRTGTPGCDLRAEQYMLSTAAPGFTEDLPDHLGAVYVNLNLQTLQMITAYITT